MFNITKPNQTIIAQLQAKIDDLTKPKGSLGMLEDLALRVGTIQQTLQPQLNNPHHIVFAADHGITDEGVSVSPKSVTSQMVFNFLQGGAGINFLARQHNINLEIVDAGVDYDFDANIPQLINKKIAKGTRNFLHQAAMTAQEAELAIKHGAETTQMCFDRGCNVISFGEMGISNTSPSAIWISLLSGIELEKCVGAGCDDSGNIVSHKYKVLKQAVENYKGNFSPQDIMEYFGGYEMVMTVGAMLKAAELGMVIIIDGFIMTACIMMASKLNANVLEYAIFGHQGDEAGHKYALEYLNAKPILHLNLRLGEGSGALCAYPIIESGVRMINEMNSFANFDVTKYF